MFEGRSSHVSRKMVRPLTFSRKVVAPEIVSENNVQVMAASNVKTVSAGPYQTTPRWRLRWKWKYSPFLARQSGFSA